MKPKLTVTERDPAKHMQDFENQPKQNQDLQQAEEQVDKSIGPERVKEQEKIRRESGTKN